jgi:nucleotide-binding universal stress UspA family protein
MPHREIRLSRVLVPTDFSPAAEAAYPWAHAMHRGFNAEVILLHVIDPDVTALTPLSMLPTPSTEEQVLERVREESTGLLSHLGAEFTQARTLIRDGSPSAVILDVASEVDAHLIVMGTHGRTGLAHVAFGSVAEHVIRHSNVPVLAIRQARIMPSR